jgi:rare lipoprotein A
MRSIIAAAGFALVAMTAGIAPASAATWSCNGPAYVCGSSSSHSKAFKKASYEKGSYHRASKSRVAYRPSKARYAYKSSRVRYAEAPARRHRSSGSSYGGGSSGGMASYYWQGQQTASGARFNPDGLTAAHRSLPFGTRVRVTNRSNGQSVIVTINDRGPFVGGRVIDLSRGAARAINMTGAGVAAVSLEVLGRS